MFNGLLDTVSDAIVSRLLSSCAELSRVAAIQAKGSERPSVSASLMKNSERSGLSYNEIAWLLGTCSACVLLVTFVIRSSSTKPLRLAHSHSSGGTETSGTTLTWWVLAMIIHPEIQRRAQDELDAVVGRSRAPTFADAPNLPYIQALVKESLRWRPPVPLGVPHTTIKDDWYEGMFTPKGTMCMVNLWHCHHNLESYGSDAASFYQERFLDERGRLIPGLAETRDDGHSSYGFGRRTCIGRYAANEVLFIDMATVLWAARLERARDASGGEVPLDTEAHIDTGIVL
jgi:hypothetical protein